jgi:uncharacterized protein (DUF934 family)
MPLVEAGHIVADRYVRVADDAAVPDGVPVIVAANRFLMDAPALVHRDGPIGVSWPNDRKVAELAPWLDNLSLVALVFPKFRDGRAYSQARLLRERYGFRGELRATGDILRDQFLFLIRAGFDSLEVRKAADATAFAEAVGRYSVFYQPSAGGWAPAHRRRLTKWHSPPSEQAVEQPRVETALRR